jgi:hypothetical protein
MSDEAKRAMGRRIADSLIRAVVGGVRKEQRKNFYDFSQPTTTMFSQVASA